MQLKVCLLIGFVLNVACLNNLSGKFLNRKYDSLIADQISLRKNESLVESFTKDPVSFVELFAKADPETISQIIGILEGLVTDASSSLETLRSHQTEATNNLNTANSNLVTADTNKQNATVGLERATTYKTNADSAYTVALGEQESAQLEKQVADQNYAEQSPGLINEHSVLQEVVDSLLSLIDRIIIVDPENNGKKCGDPGDLNRIFDLRNEEASEKNCKQRCNEDVQCVAFSGIWNSWCIGCKEELNTVNPDAIAFKTAVASQGTASPTTPPTASPPAPTLDNHQQECWNAGGCYDSGIDPCPWCGVHDGSVMYCCRQIDHNCGETDFNPQRTGHQCVVKPSAG